MRAAFPFRGEESESASASTTWLQSLAFISLEKDKRAAGPWLLQPSLICRTSGPSGRQTATTRGNQAEERADNIYKTMRVTCGVFNLRSR